jgi:Fe2+ or Zn2+ uptake regulation protein
MLEDIIYFIKTNPGFSSLQIYENFQKDLSLATIKRYLQQLMQDSVIFKTGASKNTRYYLNNQYDVLHPIDIEKYFENDIDERKINRSYNFTLIAEVLEKINLFTTVEEKELELCHNQFKKSSNQLSKLEFANDMERLAIDLSWKSSQIEGNTYSLLETEQLLKEKITAAGKTKDEAIMLLNHKEAIDFVVSNPNYMYPLTVQKIEDLHSILVKELAVSKNIRSRRVGISGTNYLPLDNEWQIKEALQATCDLVNAKTNVFEKALLTLLLISYIQPFMDGNKRTARIVSNSILIHFQNCPLSFRTVDSIDDKKAMLLFYEVNNLSAFKKLFIEQYKFAVDTYF